VPVRDGKQLLLCLAEDEDEGDLVAATPR